MAQLRHRETNRMFRLLKFVQGFIINRGVVSLIKSKRFKVSLLIDWSLLILNSLKILKGLDQICKDDKYMYRKQTLSLEEVIR